MSKLSWTVVSGSLIFGLAGFFFYHTFDDAYAVSILTAGRGPVFFPRILLVVMLALSLAVIWEGRGQTRTAVSRKHILPVMTAVGLTGLYIFAITAAGFLISTTLFVVILPRVLGYKNGWLIAAVGILYPISVWYIFNNIFKIILPSSPWFDSF